MISLRISWRLSSTSRTPSLVCITTFYSIRVQMWSSPNCESGSRWKNSDGRPFRKELRHTGHFPLQSRRVREAGGAGKNLAVAGDGHGAVLEEAMADPALGAADNLAAAGH